jgi:hypothetical protein
VIERRASEVALLYADRMDPRIVEPAAIAPGAIEVGSLTARR